MSSHNPEHLDFNSKYPQLNNDPKFKPVDSIYGARLRQFIDDGGGYSGLMLPKFYITERFDNSKPDEVGPETGYIDIKHWPAPNVTKPLFHEVIPDKLPDFKTVYKGHSFGPAWSSHWFQFKFKVPQHWIDKKYPVVLNWDAGNEGLVFTEDGLPLQGLTGNRERDEFDFPKEWYEDGKEHTFYLEMGCNGMFGAAQPSYRLNRCDVIVPNLEARALYYDFWMISDASRELGGPQRLKALEICNRIMDVFDETDITTIKQCREIAKEFVGPNVDSDKVFKEGALLPYSSVYAVGNCHIDTAWLWDFATSKTKVARSWSTQLRLIEKYPEYVFAASAAQHFKWLIDYYPDLYKKIKAAVMQGRFIVLGGSWVENDTNMPSGESLARQFLLGQRYFQNLFGFKSDIFWLPDSFGYSTQIPQICRLSGIPNFLTQKLSWNNINSFPANSFNWVGIDTSQVLVHMPPANTYTASAHFGDVKRSIHGHHNLYNDQKGMLLYGKGDGGGGPTPEMVEKLRRIRGLADKAGGEMPTVEMGCTVSDFYNKLRKDTKNGTKLPTWRGELYLEYHRGTYTTQAKVKHLMRTSELLMRDLEYLATKASILVKDYKYPHAKLEALWQDICLCQFHDVLPGSCIEKVYKEDVWPMLRHVIEKEYYLINKALDSLTITEASISSESVVKLSTLPWEKFEIVEIDNVPLSLKSNSQSGKYLAFTGSDVLTPLKEKIKYPSSITKTDDDEFYVLENSKLKAKINSNGVIVSLVDLLNDREIIDTSKIPGGNQYVMFADTPLNFPAWDTELYSLEKYKLIESSTSIEIFESGPLVSSLKVKHRLSATSYIDTVISLEGINDLAQPTMLKFDCFVHWEEIYKFLKVQFPVDIIAETANYETQFGITKRPTHFNTSWDTAKFECCCHKFIDYSDFNYGASILNNNKYGGSVHGGVMTLSLLRAPKYPDAHADLGEHHFKYAFMPHSGSLSYETVRAGWEFNERLHTVFNSASNVSLQESSSSLVTISGDKNLILSNVKRGEDDFDTDDKGSIMTNLPKKFVGSQTLILRIYESLGGASKATVSIGVPIKQVFKTNLLEEELEEIPFDAKENKFSITSRSFEISSYRVVLA